MIHMSRKTAVTSLFVLCGLLVAAAPAFGQGDQFQVSSLPQQARIEGLTETMGAVVVQATAPGTIPAGSSVTGLYSVTITSPVSGQASIAGGGGGPAGTGTGCVLSGAFGGGASPS